MNMETIQEMREEAGYTMRDVRELTGLALQTIVNIESGKSQPKTSTIMLLAELYDRPFPDVLRATMKAV